MTQLIKKENIMLGAYGFKGEDCTGVIEKFIRPDSGGRYTKFVGCNYLFPGDPRVNVINTIGTSKQLFPFLSTLLSDKMLLAGIGFLYIFRRKFLWMIFEKLLDVIYRSIYPLRLMPDKYATPVREIRRVADIIIAKFPKEMETGLVKFRDICSMNLEYDMAYRWPFQDIIPEINKAKFNENPAKEIRRVSDIFQERGGIEDDWRKFEKIILLAIRISPRVKELIIDFINELDFEKIKLTEAAWFFCLNRPNYQFRGMPYKERFKIREEIWAREGKPLTIKTEDLVGEIKEND